MGLAKVRVEVMNTSLSREGKQLLLNTRTAQFLGPIPPQIAISYGSRTVLAAVQLKSTYPGSQLGVSTVLAKQLQLAFSTQSLHARFDPQTGHFRLGPLLGILIHEPLRHPVTPPFGAADLFFVECAKAGRAVGVQVMLLTTRCFQAGQSCLGWVHNGQEWSRTLSPLPDIIYNRIAPRRAEMHPRIQELLRELREEHRIPIFNERFLSKQDVHEQLQQDPDAASLLPETLPFTSANFLALTQRHSLLYLKPNHGSLGQGILRVIRTPRQWVWQQSTPTGLVTRVASSATILLPVLKRLIHTRSYLVQQGLRLAQFEGRPFDFRILLQKNGEGLWRATSAVARVTGPQQFVSNVARGGTLHKPSEVMAALPLPPSAKQTTWRSVAFRIVKAFDAHVEGHYAELGIDLGIDQQGNWWLIEINAKPSKGENTLLTQATEGDVTHLRPSVQHLMAYTRYLAGMMITPIKRRQRPCRLF